MEKTMKQVRTFRASRISGSVLACTLVLGLGVAGQAAAQLTASNFALVPPLITESAPPNVMLVMSNDHELYKKAYSDFTDINNDGEVDGSYDDSFTYTGYFDSNFCYDYNTAQSRFEPEADISALIATDGHSCEDVDGDWSGNFLNWASMTRMDIVRHVLFGGARVVDTATAGATDGVTVLERVFLPEDTHAFAKVFTGDTEKFTPWNQAAITICNMTYGATNNAPLLRVAYGAWPLWSSSEVVQCHYRGENSVDSGLGNQPQTTNRPATYDYDAQVRVCMAGVDSGSLRCKAYTNSGTGLITYKPVGLLQRYGDSSTINFGLISGSYEKNISGGVLRKNIVPLTGNSTASLNEINLNNGIFVNQGATDAGIINTINRFRLVYWDYGNNRYSDCDFYDIPKVTFMTSTAANRQCRNWGNPLSELYLEALRYFTGNNNSAGSAAPTAAFNTSDSSHIASLPQLTWTDPLSAANSCASCSIIVISTGLNSFDKDELGTVTDLWNVAGTSRMSTGALNTLLNSLGTLEGITGGSYLIGDNGTINNEVCTAKTVSALASARGLCPEVPGMEGGFDIAGLAFHAYTKDLRNDLGGVQNISTYSVSLADNLPSYTLDVNGKAVTFVPLCKANTDGADKLDEAEWNNCSFVDAKIESQTATGGRMYIAWEDARWGNDYDMDAFSRVEWCIGVVTTTNVATRCPGEVANANYTNGTGQTNFTYNNDFRWKTSGLSPDSIQFRVSSPLAAAGNAISLGYSISGVQNQGAISLKTNTPTAAMNSGATTTGSGGSTKFIARGTRGNGEQMFLLRQGGYTISRLVNNSGNRIIYHEPIVYTADSNVTAGKILPSPLYLTAKYGSFNDIDRDGTPHFEGSSSDSREWDTRDVDGVETPDGIPDNFFPITNPAQLSTSLSQIFEIIASRISSGTAAAVVANSSTGLGSVYQAYYHPLYQDDNNASITWGGVLHSMFIDDSGRFREDNGVIGRLDDPNTDYVVDIQYDTSVSPNRTRFQRYTQTGSGVGAILTPFGPKEDLEEIGSIWNARDVLAGISQADLLLQRTVGAGTGEYDQNASTRRYLFTYLDSISTGTPGVVDAGEVVDFVHGNFDSGNGTDNYRYLGLSNPADAANLVKYIRGQDQTGWRSRLVDIPGDDDDTPKYWLLGDIVHSSPLVLNPPLERYDINFGDLTYEAFKQQYQRRRQMVYTGGNDGMLHAFNGGIWDAANRTFREQAYNPDTGLYDLGQAHTLGAEMWSYLPMNLLPHLQWLKDSNYPHVYYMDAPPQSFDVNIFADDDVHPGGWGTILVVGMRLGGGDFPVDLDGDGTKETTMSAAYVILDITDPERPPELIAELSAADLGFTTSMPALIKSRVPGGGGSYASPADNKWLLVFGSGPDTLTTAVSNGQDAKLYAYDLVARSLVSIHANAQTPAADPSGFFGDLRVADWNNDYIDDVIYVGTVEGSEITPTGRMKRIVLDHTAAHMGLSTGAAEMSQVINLSKGVTAAPNVISATDKNEKWLLFGTGRLFTTVDNRSKTQQSYFGVKEADDYDTTGLVVADLVNSTDILVEGTGAIWDEDVGDQVTIDGTDIDTFNGLYSFMDGQDGWIRNFSYNGGVDPSERVFNQSLVLGSTLVFTTYKPALDLCTVEGDGFLYALNFRTGTAEAFGPFGQDVSGVAFASIDLGQGAPSAPTAVVRTGTDAGVDASNVGDISIVTGSTTGVTSSTGFSSAPVTSGRLSWEELDILF